MFTIPATASYRLLPHIIIKEPIPSADADEFARCFTPGVIAVKTDFKTKEKTIKVVEPRKDTVSREVLRHDKFKDKVELARIRDHFICMFSSLFSLLYSTPLLSSWSYMYITEESSSSCHFDLG